MGLKNPYILQGVNHVKDISENIWKKTMTGHLLTANLEQLRLEIGTNCDILSADYKEYEKIILTQSYVQSTWKFMSENHLKLNDKTEKVKMLREGDVSLMEIFMKKKDISSHELLTLNRCRIYLKVFSLADVTTGDGKQLKKEIMMGRISETGRDTKHWPRWEKPTLSAWSTWRSALIRTFCDNYQNRNLRQPLGKWTHIPKEWKWFVTTEDKNRSLIVKTDDKWRSHKKLGRSKIQQRFEKKVYYLTKNLKSEITYLPQFV